MTFWFTIQICCICFCPFWLWNSWFCTFSFFFFLVFFFFLSVNRDRTKYNINTPTVPSNQVSLLNFLIDIKSRAAPLAHNQLYITEIWKAKEVTDRGNKVLHYFVEKKACTVLGGCNRWHSNFEKSRTWVGQDTFIN